MSLLHQQRALVSVFRDVLVYLKAQTKAHNDAVSRLSAAGNGVNLKAIPYTVSRKGMIVRVGLKRNYVGDIVWRLENLSGSHHQSHVNCTSSVALLNL